MSKRDYYEILGVERTASDDELKRAFRKKAMHLHPDRNPDNPEAEKEFKEVGEAYEALKDPQKRAAYDRFGHAAFQNGGGAGPGAGPGGFDFGFGGSFTDIFEEVFGDFMGGRRGRGGSTRGADVRYDMEISLEDAFEGAKKTIRIPVAETCESCDGTGSAEGKAPETCSAWGGVGKVRMQQGFFTIERTCPTCRGTGREVKDKCKTCQGTGREERSRELDVTVPAGVEDGTRLRVGGRGEAGVMGGPPGDLYVFLTVAPHPFFKREGADLLCITPLPMVTAALGGEIEVPTIEGKKAKIRIPAGTQTDHRFRLKGKGMKVLRSDSRGDLFVQVRVETPVNMNKKQKDLLKEFADQKKDTHPETTKFLKKMKNFWKGFQEKSEES